MKIALVTGASSGMGRESVLQIGDRFGGLDEIWAVARRAGRLEALARESAVPVRCFALDLTEEEDLRVLAEALAAQHPQIRLLVNAAGYGKLGSIGDVPRAEETGMVRLNCEALCAVTHLALPYMAKNSRILQFASAAAFLPQPGFGIYAATKAFVLSYSRALDAELRGRGIFVTAVCPGPVRTEFFETAGDGSLMPFYKRLAMADPKRVVRCALRDSMMGKRVSVYGVLMKAFWLFCKAIPHGLILRGLAAAQGKGPDAAGKRA